MKIPHFVILTTAALAMAASAQVQTGTVPNSGPVPAAGAATSAVDLDNIATIPYQALIKIAQSDASQPKDATVYTLRISSKIGVPVSQIELFLNRAAAPEKLTIDANGYFLVPNTAELAKENPVLVSNQPKGSLNLEVKLSLPKPEMPAIKNGKLTYQELFKPILTLNASMQKVDPLFGQPEQQQFAIEIATGAQGGVRVQRQFGARTLKPDSEGIVWLVFEKLLFDENPEIQITPGTAALSVRPVSAARALDIRAR